MPGEPTCTTFKTMCFTLNNPTIEEEKSIKSFFESDKILRAVFQKEEGKEKTPHFQGYFALNSPMKFKTLKKQEGFERCHFEQPVKNKNSAANNLHYCTKPQPGCTCKHCVACPARLDGPWIYPNIEAFPKMNGERNDLKELMADIKSGMSIDDIKDKYPGQYLRMKKAITDEVNEHYVATKPKKFAPLLTTYMYGDSDTNKTRYALEMAKKEYKDEEIFEFSMPDSGKLWWDTYTKQKCVIVNEFNGQFGVEYFNNLLDGKIAAVEVKGGFKIANFERLYITSNHKWSELWAKTFAKNKELGRAVFRRLDQIIKFEKGADPVYEKYCERRVDDGETLPEIAKPEVGTGSEMPDIDFVEEYRSKKRKLNDLEGDTVIGSDGEAMSRSYASNPANFKKRKTQEDEDEDGQK